MESFAVLRGGLAKKMGGYFWGGADIPMHTMSKVGEWGIFRNGVDLSNRGDNFKTGGVGVMPFHKPCCSAKLLINH